MLGYVPEYALYINIFLIHEKHLEINDFIICLSSSSILLWF